MAIFAIDVTISATAYVIASDAAEAVRIAKERAGYGLEIPDQGGDIPITGAPFPNLHPVFSLSPAMTYQGPDDGEQARPVES